MNGDASIAQRLRATAHKSKLGRLFFDKKFAHYTWIGVFISILNVFLLWLFIDVLDMHTVLASVIVIGGTFVLRYILFDVFKII